MCHTAQEELLMCEKHHNELQRDYQQLAAMLESERLSLAAEQEVRRGMGTASLWHSIAMALTAIRENAHGLLWKRRVSHFPLNVKFLGRSLRWAGKDFSCNDVGLFRTQLLRVAKACEYLHSHSCQNTSGLRGSVILQRNFVRSPWAVSYTHLTLPTICSV